MRAGLVQMSSGDDPAANLEAAATLISRAADAGAGFVLTPECTNMLSLSRRHQAAHLHPEPADPTLAGLRDLAHKRGIWLLIGSLGLRTQDADGRFANRSFLIGPDGGIVARYDKIHMFDVDVSPQEKYRESEAYRPGAHAVTAQTPFGTLGMAVCYDLRFPHLFRALAQGGARILTLPAAFNDTTGAAHWEPLLRARAIENGAIVLAPAQCGTHPGGRRTFGHSLAVGPWGEILADGGTAPGVTLVDLPLEAVDQARQRIPALSHDRPFEGPV